MSLLLRVFGNSTPTESVQEVIAREVEGGRPGSSRLYLIQLPPPICPGMNRRKKDQASHPHSYVIQTASTARFSY